MQLREITFNTTGREQFIDFLKAYVILCVLFAHTFPYLHKVGYGLWVGMQVPVFLLIQVFHAFKSKRQSSLKKISNRIFMPFLTAQAFILILSLIISNFDKDLILNMLTRGGDGPGSYYPWIYLQFALILPYFGRFMKDKSKMVNAVAIILICEIIEVTISLLDLPDSIYRLLCVRYLFIIYLGWKWVEEGIQINKTTLTLSVISFIACIYFGYIASETEPWFYNTGWRFHRWPCYYYVSHLYVYILYQIYQFFKQNQKVLKCIELLSRASYEIFLVQMVVIYLVPASYHSHSIIQLLIWMITMWLISIFVGIFAFYMKQNYESPLKSPF